MEIPNNRMVVFPAGSLVIEERFRIMREEDDGAGLTTEYLLQAAATRIGDILPLRHHPGDEEIVRLVRAAALLTVAADRLILAKEADDEAHA